MDEREQGIYEQVRLRVARAAYIEPTAITSATRFLDDLGIQSMTALELIIELEEQYGIRITDAEAGALHTVADGVDLIAAKLASRR
jgi:acyl carrier protein